MFTVFDEVPQNGYLNVSTENDGFPVGWRVAVAGGPSTGIMKQENGGMSKRRERGGRGGDSADTAKDTDADTGGTIDFLNPKASTADDS